MRFRILLTLSLLTQMTAAGFSEGDSSKIIGRWKVEVTFSNGESRVIQFDAQGSGKGSFLVIDPRLKYWGPAKPSEATWAQSANNSLTFSGPVEFLLGNVGRDAGTLVLKGKLGSNETLSGTAAFYPLDQNPTNPKATPSKNGSFKATRIPADK